MTDNSKTPNENEEHLTSSKKYFDVDTPVFWPSALVIVTFIAVTLIVGQPMDQVFSSIQSNISNFGGWFFILSVNIFLFFVLYIAFSKYGKIRLGGAKSRPEFSTTAWFAMLFSAGMGIGILFWSKTVKPDQYDSGRHFSGIHACCRPHPFYHGFIHSEYRGLHSKLF
jgi:choline/glycine/proline betaine transport protein